MGLFSKWKKKSKYDFDFEDEYADAFEELTAEYGVKTEKATDKLVIEELHDGDDIVKYVDLVSEGKPCILNFEHLDVDEANKALHFMAGALYALHGETVTINDHVYLFASKQDFMDGTLRKFLDEL